MHSKLTRCVGLLIFFTGLAVADPANVLSDVQWQADLQQLAGSIKEIHFKPFHVLPEDEFDTAVENLAEQIPDMSDDEIIVAMAQIVASLRDGHTRLHIPRLYPELAIKAELGHSGTPPPHHGELRFLQSPLRFELFSDGLFVIAARSKHERLIGQKVVRIDDTPVEEALAQVRSVGFFENDSRARLMAPDRLALPQVTKSTGVSKSSEVVRVTTADKSGRTSTTKLRSLRKPGLDFIIGVPETLPLWLAQPEEYRWYQLLPDRDAIYVQINEFEENPVKPYGDFVAETLAAARAAGVTRFVIDLRHNFGGVGAWVTPFVTGLVGSEYNQYGRLFVLTGRTTFSASQKLIHNFEEFTYAMFVGEPSGGKPSHYGDSKRIILDHSGLTLRVSTIYWHSWLANDFRDEIQPHLTAAIASADYFSGRDPVLDAALDYRPPESLGRQIEEQFRQQKNQNALILFQRFMSDARVADHRRAMPDILSAADRLIEDGLVRPGYFLYLLASRSYPDDAEIQSGLEATEQLVR